MQLSPLSRTFPAPQKVPVRAAPPLSACPGPGHPVSSLPPWGHLSWALHGSGTGHRGALTGVPTRQGFQFARFLLFYLRVFADG